MTISDVEILSRTPADEVRAHRFTREEYEQMDFGPDVDDLLPRKGATVATL